VKQCFRQVSGWIPRIKCYVQVRLSRLQSKIGEPVQYVWYVGLFECTVGMSTTLGGLSTPAKYTLGMWFAKLLVATLVSLHVATGDPGTAAHNVVPKVSHCKLPCKLPPQDDVNSSRW
jgi:hypothetical protein